MENKNILKPHKYIGDPNGKYNCRVCSKPVYREWAYFRGFYYHRRCLFEMYPKLG